MTYTVTNITNNIRLFSNITVVMKEEDYIRVC